MLKHIESERGGLQIGEFIILIFMGKHSHLGLEKNGRIFNEILMIVLAG